MKILDTPITIFQSATSTTGNVVNLGEFLNDTSTRQLIESIRSTEDKTKRKLLKSQLPCAVISALCPDGRKSDLPYQHSGLICIDIDGQDNPAFGSGAELKSEVSKVSEVALCALSASGSGCFTIIRLSRPEEHLGHFLALQRLFKLRLGITIDSQCKDVKRLRYATFDPEPYINDDAPAFRIVDVVTPHRPDTATTLVRHDDKESVTEKVARLTDEIVRRRIDLTVGYANWVEIGMSLTNLGEAGRGYFHAISSIYPRYNHAEADRKFSELLRSTKKVTIATFFHYCKQYGLNLAP